MRHARSFYFLYFLNFILVLFPGKIFPQSNTGTPTIDSSRLYELFRLARQAGGQNQYESAKRFLDTALIIAPDFSSIRFSHLKVCLRTGRTEEALSEIDLMISQRLLRVLDITSDSLIVAVVGTDPHFKAALKKLDLFSTPVGAISRPYTVPDKAQLPEGITNDPVTGTVYLSSIYLRKVISIESPGNFRDFIKSKQDDVLGVVGLAVDPKKKILYLCSSYTPLNIIKDTGDIKDKHTAVYAYDLKTARLLHKYSHKNAVFFNDLTVAPNGNVYVTDSDGSIVYRIRPDEDIMEPYISRPILYGANGISFDERGENLYVAAYLGGILKVNVNSATKTWLTKPDTISLAGIDGMEWYKNSLIVNSPTEHRAIRRLYLNGDQTGIIKEEILAYDPGSINETTTGTIVGNSFYFIMNSGLDNFEKNGTLNMQKLKPAVIGKCVLK